MLISRFTFLEPFIFSQDFSGIEKGSANSETEQLHLVVEYGEFFSLYMTKKLIAILRVFDLAEFTTPERFVKHVNSENVFDHKSRVNTMMSAARNFRFLTLNDEDYTLSLEVKSDERMTVGGLADILHNIEKLYSAIESLVSPVEHMKLEIAKIESGSNVRFDLSGLGEIVEKIKEAFLEIYDRWVFSKQIEKQFNAETIIRQLHLLDDVQGSKLNQEAKNRAQKDITKSILSLTNAGVTTTELPDKQVIESSKFLKELSNKRIEHQPDVDKERNVEEKGKTSAKKVGKSKGKKPAKRAKNKGK